MSNSKPLPSFILDTLNYLNRDQLDRFSIVCRPLKNLIDRYFSSKPYRIFHHLEIRRGSYALGYKGVHWHPNRYDYSVQQFLAGQRCIGNNHGYSYYSFTQMRLYLGPAVRLSGGATIYIGGDIIYTPEHITEMESIAHLWRDVWINILSDKEGFIPTVAEDFQPILNSPTILQCRELHFIGNADFSFKDYQVLYAVDKINIDAYDVEINPKHWPEFLEKPGVKPIVILGSMRRENVANVLDRISKIQPGLNPAPTPPIQTLFAIAQLKRINNELVDALDLTEEIMHLVEDDETRFQVLIFRSKCFLDSRDVVAAREEAQKAVILKP
ncbi:hypothetical protein Ddc_18651 [Ditylenchus destructor]|nr:hypothetical protein Ddc_18651 [Ditylenchus destructor]